MKLYQVIARLVGAYHNCKKDPSKADWQERHADRIKVLVDNHLPSGNGFNHGFTLNLDLSTEDKLAFSTSYQHELCVDTLPANRMTEHTIIVRPSLSHDFRCNIGGKGKSVVKTRIDELFNVALSADVTALTKE